MTVTAHTLTWISSNSGEATDRLCDPHVDYMSAGKTSNPVSTDGPLRSLVRKLYPICRSITGDGVRETLKIVSERLPLEIHEVPSGTSAFDWEVPNEWNIRDAFIENMDGQRVVDFRSNNLHVLNYSAPIDRVVDRKTLDDHLFSLPEHPKWIPYRTSYYTERWGFCVSHDQREKLRDSEYRVRIDSDLKPGSLTYGECQIPGEEDLDVVLYTHICHPSLCNDNLSGIAVAAALGRKIFEWPRRRFNYRIVFGPGTIGSIVWLSRNQQSFDRISHGLVLGLLGDSAPLTYKESRAGNHEIDHVARYTIGKRSSENRCVPFTPYGYDERQFGSPGINLPIGRLTRSENGGYPQYHTSADDMSIVSESQLSESLDTGLEILEIFEANHRYVNLAPYCEPQLGKRGLYRSTGGTQIEDRESAMLWLLNQSDGSRSLLDIAKVSGVRFQSLLAVANELEQAGLIIKKHNAG